MEICINPYTAVARAPKHQAQPAVCDTGRPVNSIKKKKKILNEPDHNKRTCMQNRPPF